MLTFKIILQSELNNRQTVMEQTYSLGKNKLLLENNNPIENLYRHIAPTCDVIKIPVY